MKPTPTFRQMLNLFLNFFFWYSITPHRDEGFMQPISANLAAWGHYSRPNNVLHLPHCCNVACPNGCTNCANNGDYLQPQTKKLVEKSTSEQTRLRKTLYLIWKINQLKT